MVTRDADRYDLSCTSPAYTKAANISIAAVPEDQTQALHGGRPFSGVSSDEVLSLSDDTKLYVKSRDKNREEQMDGATRS